MTLPNRNLTARQKLANLMNSPDIGKEVTEYVKVKLKYDPALHCKFCLAFKTQCMCPKKTVDSA